MRIIATLLLLLWWVTSVQAFPPDTPPSNFQFFDGCEGFTGGVGAADGSTKTALAFADTDVKGSSDIARTGRRSCKIDNPGSGDNIAVMNWTSCSAPSETQTVQCAAPDRALGAQQFATALHLTSAPDNQSWMFYVGNRACQEGDPHSSPVGCSTKFWDDGATFIKLTIGAGRIFKVEAQSAGPVPTPTPGGSASVCIATHAIALDETIDVSAYLIANSPSTGQMTVALRIQDDFGSTKFIEDPSTGGINCALQMTSFPAAGIWMGWDKSVGGTGIFPFYLDDLVFTQTTYDNNSFIFPYKGYWIGSADTGSSADMLLAEDSVENTFGSCVGEAGSPACSASEKIDSLTQVPATNAKYLSSCPSPGGVLPPTCISAEQFETFTTPTITYSENTTTGAPSALTDYPVTLHGPLVAVQSVGYIAGPSGNVPRAHIGVRDTAVGSFCRTSSLVMADGTIAGATSYRYLLRRDPLQVGNGACDGTTSDFDCLGASCAGSVVDYAHQLRIAVTRDGGTGANTLVKQLYKVPIYLKYTPIPNTPTQTRTVTPTNTRTFTATPLFSLTPTTTPTPTWTPTATWTATSGATKTPSSTFGPTVKVDYEPHARVCQTGPCTFCLKSDPDPRVVLARAKAARTRCPQGVTVVADRSLNAVPTPAPATDTTQPGVPIGGLGLFSGLTFECRDPQVIKGTAVSPLFNWNDTVLDNVTLRGPCILDGGSIAIGQGIVDLVGVSHVLIDGFTFRFGNADGLHVGGGDAVAVSVSNNRFERTTGGSGKSIRFFSCARGPCERQNNREAQVTATPTP